MKNQRVDQKVAGILIIAFCVPALCVAQAGVWNVVQMNPGISLHDLCILPDAQHGWAVGYERWGGDMYSVVLRTTNGGTNWNYTSSPDSTSACLSGICFVTQDSGWVVGRSGVIYRTTNGGNTWTPQISGTTRILSKVYFANSTHGWTVGGWNQDPYLVLRTTNGGATWQNFSFGYGFSCDDVYFYDTLNGWIVGQDASFNGQIHRTTNGGLSWVRQTIPSEVGVVTSVDFASPNIGWATTHGGYPNQGAILHTTNGGDTWTVQSATNLYYNYCIDCQSVSKVALAGFDLSSSTEKIFVSSDGGQSWNSYTPPVAMYTFGIQYVGNNVWICLEKSQILMSTNNGAAWDWQHHAPLWRSMAWSTPIKGWVVCGSDVDADGYCYRTTDAGVTWFRDADVPGGAQVMFMDSNIGWMLWEGNGSSVWRTTNGGTDWNQYSIGTSSWIDGIFFISADSGWAFGSNGTIRFTQNGGATWSSQTSGTTNYVQTVYFVNPQEGWAAGGYGTGNGFILYTTNNGATWESQTPAQPDHFQTACFLNDQEGWMAGVGCRVHKTTNGGVSWQVVGQVNHDYSDKILMKDPETGWLAVRNHRGSVPGDDGRGFIYKTTDGGTSWILEWSGPWVRSSITDLAFQPDETLWGCGVHSTILRYAPPSGISEINTNSTVYALFQISPNPFREKTDITFSIGHPDRITRSSYGTERIELKIYDVSGRMVKEFILPTAYSLVPTVVSWDAKDADGSQVSAGVYFAKLDVGDYSVVKKLLLVR